MAAEEVAALEEMSELPGHHVTWFCNCLTFRPAFATYQRSLFSREDLEAKKKEVKA